MTEGMKVSCFTWSWKKLRGNGSAANSRKETKARCTLHAIEAARDSIEHASNTLATESSASSEDDELLVRVVGNELFANDSPTTPRTPRQSNSPRPTQTPQKKREFVWVGIDAHKLEKMPNDVVSKVLEERNKALAHRSEQKDNKKVVPSLELKFSNQANVSRTKLPNGSTKFDLDDKDAVVEKLFWDDPELPNDPDLSPQHARNGFIMSLRRLPSFGTSMESTHSKEKRHVQWLSPKRSRSFPANGRSIDDENILQSAANDDEKVQEGGALLRPSEVIKKTPRGMRKANQGCSWGDCPLTLDAIKVPVRACDGKVYERWAIEKWLKDNQNRSPLTNIEINPALELLPLAPMSEPSSRSLSGHSELCDIEESVGISGGNFGLVEDDEGNIVTLDDYSSGPNLLDELKHLDGAVLALVRLSIPAHTPKGQQLMFERGGEAAKAVYGGEARGEAHDAVFALLESEVSKEEISVQPDEIPGGLTGIRQRMAKMGHSVARPGARELSGVL